MKWQFVEGRGNAVIDYLEPMFKEFKIIEHNGNSWKLKVSRDEYSIGFLFGLMEDILKSKSNLISASTVSLRLLLSKYLTCSLKKLRKKLVESQRLDLSEDNQQQELNQLNQNWLSTD